MKPSKRQRTKVLMHRFAMTPAGLAAELSYRLKRTIQIMSK